MLNKTTKSYRGITWNGTNTDLSLKLGKSSSYVSTTMDRNKLKTQEQVIDYVILKNYSKNRVD